MKCPFCGSENTRKIPEECRGDYVFDKECMDCGSSWIGDEINGYGIPGGNIEIDRILD